MTQISRPYQVALIALVVLAAVWFVALRGHSGESSTSSSAPGAAQTTTSTPPTAAAEAKAAAAPTPIYHGAAPGLEGLTRAIAKAHEAVAGSQQQAKQVEHESAESSPAAGTSVPAQTSPATRPGSAATGAAGGRANATPASPSMQGVVEAELRQGKIVTILFWNPKSSVDRTVHAELGAVGARFGSSIAVHNAHAVQVGSFGSITRTVQVSATPTIVIVNPRGRTDTITGLTDAFAIEQAIDEARKP